MIIVSQDKKHKINYNDIKRIVIRLKLGIACRTKEGDIMLGIYKNKKRVEEVLKELAKYTNGRYETGKYMDPQIVKDENIKDMSNTIYEIPEE